MSVHNEILNKISEISIYDPVVASHLLRLYNGLINKTNESCSTVDETVEFYQNRYNSYLDRYLEYINMIKTSSELVALIEDAVTNNYALMSVTGNIIPFNFDNIVTFNGLKSQLQSREDDYFFTGCVVTTPPPSTPPTNQFDIDEGLLQSINDVINSVVSWKDAPLPTIRSNVYRRLFIDEDVPYTTKEEKAQRLYLETKLKSFIERFELPIFIPPYLV